MKVKIKELNDEGEYIKYKIALEAENDHEIAILKYMHKETWHDETRRKNILS